MHGEERCELSTSSFASHMGGSISRENLTRHHNSSNAFKTYKRSPGVYPAMSAKVVVFCAATTDAVANAWLMSQHERSLVMRHEGGRLLQICCCQEGKMYSIALACAVEAALRGANVD